MSIRPFILGLALAAPLFAQAGYSINNSAFSCSAALSFANSTGLDAHCTGNFSVTGGTWTSDTNIALSADGSLTLDGVTMTAPLIELNSLTQVALLGATLIRSTGSNPRSDTTSDGFVQVPGRVELQDGADIDVRMSAGEGGRLVRTQSGSISLGGGGSLMLSDAPSDIKARLSLNGDVVLQNTSGIQFAAGRTPGELVLAGNAGLVASSFSIDSSQTPLIWAASVPEPESYALALAALAILGSSATLAHRRKA
jgi:hypothetical protein